MQRDRWSPLPKLLTSVDQKVERFAECGMESAFVLPFDERFAETTERHCVNSTSIKFIKGVVPTEAEAPLAVTDYGKLE